ncbi:HAMP domain-containing sensor histidine kinase [Bacillus sp. DTU_2020_1000418_1_SI_GHA_SEK_038]|uniref:HAMP domain-containing sensor histidine kinase n=1 Tax=Bacillus sp. DTU_2020_1000418_1_SI_GHA_SEK_038 TaxID=3077585 RepID=UPI0028E62B86|nr:HAMP domain-containing sensor histidine kinase [Bacillus sp. DTU_2020_1000418_1_SI_GHA_SEK_038]WNS75423.1 HAMP domain-containing sensor histidine kinase [Bacillus sp. DTU_2020_1000418_1_SI_GHA_SEK_038]
MKKYSHLMTTKIIVFIMMITCFTGAIQASVDLDVNDHFGIVFEDNYFRSHSFVRESEPLIFNLSRLIGEYKNEEHILNGGTIRENELRNEEENLFEDYQFHSKSFNPNLSEAENYGNFKEEYADKISHARDRLIKNDLREFHLLLQNIKEVKGPLYYASDGENVYKNSTQTEKGQFKTYPAYLVFEDYSSEIYPEEIEENESFYSLTEEEFDQKGQVIYVAFTDELINNKIKEWKENKAIATKDFYRLVGFFSGFILLFLYLITVAGRKSFKDEEVHLHAIDKLYVDINIFLFSGLTVIWVAMMESVTFSNIHKAVIPITIPISAAGFMLFLSLVRHCKNRTFFKHTLIYQIIYALGKFIGDVYKNGNVAVKTVLIVIGYPILIALTFFMFPITLGLAAWFSLRRIKSFNAIKEGVERIKDGDIHHSIDVGGKGEFAKLAANINSITDGLKKAVDSELRSERLKTELITNVSHDIRTPLTSIITYVDLLKKEKDPAKVEEYIEVLDQKSKRLKILTDDLFEAAKTSSGNIPVHLERIDIESLINQGLGEVNDKIEELGLEFKFNYPKEKVYMKADGKLLWRSIENVLSNIFKYALNGSRVYIDIEDAGNEILLTFKNISAYELNISADELMERFKRGDESRSSQGSGLGLSIAESLTDIQKGKFIIQIDGDLFKTMIYMPKYSD